MSKNMQDTPVKIYMAAPKPVMPDVKRNPDGSPVVYMEAPRVGRIKRWWQAVTNR